MNNISKITMAAVMAAGLSMATIPANADTPNDMEKCQAWPKLEKMIVVQLNMPVLANLKQMVQQLTGFICPKVLVKSWLTAQLKAN